jgi:hypothetical protein
MSDLLGWQLVDIIDIIASTIAGVLRGHNAISRGFTVS